MKKKQDATGRDSSPNLIFEKPRRASLRPHLSAYPMQMLTRRVRHRLHRMTPCGRSLHRVDPRTALVARMMRGTMEALSVLEMLLRGHLMDT